LPFSAGDSLNHDPGILICKNAHDFTPNSLLSPQRRRGRREYFFRLFF
jgi:hypothetical protein